MSRLGRLRERLYRRKHNRERKRRLHQHFKVLREMRAIRKIRRLIHLALLPRTMFDAVTVDNIPPRARAVAGYVDGDYQTWPTILHDFPHARHISIAVSAKAMADCLDVETGDASIAEAPGWYRRFKEAAVKNKQPHRHPIFYTSASSVAALIAELGRHGVERHEYVIWSAHYNERRHVCSPKTCGYPAAEATQWTTHRETVDESKLKLSFWRQLGR